MRGGCGMACTQGGKGVGGGREPGVRGDGGGFLLLFWPPSKQFATGRWEFNCFFFENSETTNRH